MQLRDHFLTGLETPPLNLLTRAGKNQINPVLGFLNKKGEEDDSNRIPFVQEEGMTNDSVIHPIHLDEPVGVRIQIYHRKWTDITTNSLVINVIPKRYFLEFQS